MLERRDAEERRHAEGCETLMSQKIYKSNADRQAAYRARLRRQACDAYWANAVTDWRGTSAEQLEKMKSAHKRRRHGSKLRGLYWINIGHPYCPLCQTAELLTVTQDRKPVTVRKTHYVRDGAKLTKCHRQIENCVIAPQGTRATCEKCQGNFGQNTVTPIRIPVTVQTEGAASGNV